jgi:hypothetical protein
MSEIIINQVCHSVLGDEISHAAVVTIAFPHLRNSEDYKKYFVRFTRPSSFTGELKYDTSIDLEEGMEFEVEKLPEGWPE